MIKIVDKFAVAAQEIHGSLFIVYACLKYLGTSFDNTPKTFIKYLGHKILFSIFVFTICYHTFSDFMYILDVVQKDPKFENIIPYIHLVAYGFQSIVKLYTIWSKRLIFGKLIRNLIELWSMTLLDTLECQTMKEGRLKLLRIQHIWFSFMNICGLVFYSLSPIVVHFYKSYRGIESKIGFIWACWYPFDKHKPIAHVIVYFFEIFVGYTCDLITITSELMFTSMANHINILLRALHMRLRALGSVKGHDYYKEVIDNVKLHQRIMTFSKDVEDNFCLMNLSIVVMSSISICCLLFISVLIEPVFFIHHKIYLVAYIIHVFMLCWYADNVYNANAQVAIAAYECKWYNLDPRSQRILTLIICRSQKPLGFTAMKFTIITLVTYSTIMSRSYSYFTLLCTMYTKPKTGEV